MASTGQAYNGDICVILYQQLLLNLTYFLTESTIDTLGHVNVISGCPPRPVRSLLSLDGDGLGWTHGLAQLAGNTSFLTRGIPEDYQSTDSSIDKT